MDEEEILSLLEEKLKEAETLPDVVIDIKTGEVISHSPDVEVWTAEDLRKEREEKARRLEEIGIASVVGDDFLLFQGTNTSDIDEYWAANWETSNPLVTGISFSGKLDVAEDFAHRKSETEGGKPTIIYAGVPGVKFADLTTKESLDNMLAAFAQDRGLDARKQVGRDKSIFKNYLRDFGFDGVVFMEETSAESSSIMTDHSRHGSVVVFGKDIIDVMGVKELDQKDIKAYKRSRIRSEEMQKAVFLEAAASYFGAELKNYKDVPTFIREEVVEAAARIADILNVENAESTYGNLRLVQNAIVKAIVGREYREKYSPMVEKLRSAGFNIERRNASPYSISGIHKPSVIDFKYKDDYVLTIVHKDFKSTKPEKLNRELLLSRALNWINRFEIRPYLDRAKLFDRQGLNIPVTREVGEAYITEAVYSAFEHDYTVDEALTFQKDFDERKIVDSLVDFNVFGTYASEKCVEGYLASQKRILDANWSNIVQIKLDNTRKIFDIMEDMTSEKARDIDMRKCKHISSDPNKNYKSEFVRRIQRAGIKNGFIDHFVDKYIKPMMNNRRVLSHNDLHIGNIFTRGKIIDLESVCYGALGSDFARYLLSKYTQGTAASEEILKRKTVQDIVDDNEDTVRYFVDRYNSVINEELLNGKVMKKELGLEELKYDDFVHKLKGMMMYYAFSHTSSAIKDAKYTGDLSFLQIAFNDFNVFYSSLDEEEKKSFEESSKDSEGFERFLKLHKDNN